MVQSKVPYNKNIGGKRYRAWSSYDTKREADKEANRMRKLEGGKTGGRIYSGVRVVKTSEGYTLYVKGGR